MNSIDCMSDHIISRFQRLARLLSTAPWAAGPGYYISRRWRLKARPPGLESYFLCNALPLLLP